MAVDPRDPARLYRRCPRAPVRAKHRTGSLPLHRRGKTFHKILYKDETPVRWTARLDPRDPNTLYAVLWQRGRARGRTGRGRARQRAVQIHRRRTTWRPFTRGLPTFARGTRAHRHRPGPQRSQTAVCLVDAKKGGLYRSDDAGESGGSWATRARSGVAGAISHACGWTRRTDTFTWRTPPCTARPTAGKHSRQSRARPAATIITPSGSTLTIGTLSCRRPTRARACPSTAEKPGVPGTTSRRRSSITSSPTTGSRTGYTAGSRRAAPRGSLAAAITGRSPFATGTRSASRNMAMSRPTRSTRISFTAAKPRVTTKPMEISAGRTRVDPRQAPLPADRAAAVFSARSSRAVPRR